MDEKDAMAGVFPNRPDALGIFSDSSVPEDPDPRSPYSRTRYARALERLIDRLLLRSDVAKGRLARGKRRLRTRPQEQSNTVRAYLKALELFSYYSVGMWGREIEPREITLDIARTFARWMAGEGPGPDVRQLYVRALGPEYVAVFEGVRKACATYGEASITQILENIEPNARRSIASVPSDPRMLPDVRPLHQILGKLIRSFKTILRSPTSAELRQSEREIWSERERNPYTYRYALAPRNALAPKSVATHLGCLSAVWDEIARASGPDEPPMAFNPWKDVYADWSWRDRREKDNARARGESACLSRPLANAMRLACVGPEIWHRRDAFALALLVYSGLRAEELAGLLRSDLREQSGLLSVNVLGKGNKIRNIILDRLTRDALVLLTNKLEELARETARDESDQLSPTPVALYYGALLQPDAPLVPSLKRWGCNDRSVPPAQAALEPLDTSGVRAMIEKIAERARVKVVATGEVRPLTDGERSKIHPHAFRHYAATAAKQAGIDLMEIRMQLGHASTATTETYIAIPAQISSAFALAVERDLARQGPLTPEQLSEARRATASPLDDPTIIEWEPEVPTDVSSVARITPLTEDERRQTVQAPEWAYAGQDVMLAYLPYGVTAKRFSADVKRREGEAQALVEQARSEQDSEGYARAVALLSEARARHLWVTFRLGRLSRLPFWAGRANRWKHSQLAPIVSYAQVASENEADAQTLTRLRALYDRFYAERGPTAAAALVAWLGELLSVVGVEFAKAMTEREDAWLPYEAPSPPDARVVREHDPAHIEEWFSTYAHAAHASGYKSARNRGNLAIAALDTLPEWFFVADPLLDPKYGLSAKDRQDLRIWITGLQATRSSSIRLALWVEQMAVRMVAWSQAAQTYRERTGKEWRWQGEYTDRDAFALATDADDMGKEFDIHFPNVLERVDVPALIASLGSQPQESAAKIAIDSLLASAGVDAGDPSRARMAPVMRLRAGALHMFDPELLRFNAQDTIEHPDRIRQWWFERYGTDSECVVRRALRVLWDRRRSLARSQAHGLIARHFDLELSALIPCAPEIERRIRAAGWTPPANVDDTVKAARVLLAGLGDCARLSQGIDPVTNVPAQAVESFWSAELPDVLRLVEEFSPAVASVSEADPLAQAQIEQATRAEAGASAAPTEAALPTDTPRPPLGDLRVEDFARLEQRLQEAGAGAELDDTTARVREAAARREQADVPSTPLDEWEEIERRGAQSAAERGRRVAQMRAERYLYQQKLADALAASAERTSPFGWWRLDAGLFWALLDPSDAQQLVFSTAPGSAEQFSVKFLRDVRDRVRRLAPSIWWDPAAGILRLRWREGKAGLNLHADKTFEGKYKGAHAQQRTALRRQYAYLQGPAVVVQFWAAAELTPNARPSWHDPAPWAPRWPGYPMPDPADSHDTTVAQLPWPSDPIGKPLHTLAFDACMQEYQHLKRNGVRSGALPPGWLEGASSEPTSALRTLLPHPVDFAFAVVRPA